MLRKVSHLIILLLTLFVIAASSSRLVRAEIDWNAYAWDQVYVPGGEVRDGMLLPGRLLVRFAEGAAPQELRAKAQGGIATGQIDLDRAAERIGLISLETLFDPAPLAKAPLADTRRDLYYVATFDPDRQSLRAAAAELDRVASIELVEPDPMHLLGAVVPNDPGFSQQWWLRSLVYGGGDVRALATWNHTTGGEDIIVCVADSGTDWKHPDLGGTAPDYIDGVIWINEAELNGLPGEDSDGNGKIDDVRGWDFVTGVSGAQSPPQDTQTPDNDPMDYDGHGTWVAGCVSALSDNGIGIASTNWNAKVMVCRIGWLPPDSDLGVVAMSFAAQSMDYARINGAHIYNASWGSSGVSALVTATDNAIAAGMIIVTAAGNSNNQEASYLAGRSDVIAVAATTQSDNKASFSSYGPWVDISAPGASIYTTAYNRYGSNGSEHTYGAASGTSFASPIVAGGFALAKSAFPDDTREQLIARVLAAVDPIDTKNPGFAKQLGSGRLNLSKLFDHGPFWRVPDQLPTLIDAMNIAAPGDSIAVASNMVFTSRISLPDDKPLSILGAWNDAFTARDLEHGLTRVAPTGGSGSAIKVLGGTTSGMIFDGFEISGGKAGLVSFEPIDGRYGGGILTRDASVVFRNLRITNNVAGEFGEYGAGGGIAVLGGSPVFENVVVSQNSARRGAGIYVHRGAPVFRNVQISDNNQSEYVVGEVPRGGGMYVLNAPSAEDQAGGATEVLFEDCTVENHSVAGSGGGVYVENSSLRMVSTKLRDNRSTSRGGGLYVKGGTLVLEHTDVRDNAIAAGAFESGGGVYTEGAVVSIDASRFQGNTSTLGGGGLMVASASSLSLTNSFVVGNTAAFFGSGLQVDAMPMGALILANTVAGNRGGTAGANGLYLSGGSVLLERNIVAFNGDTSGNFADGIAVSGTSVTAVCNLVHGNAGGNWSGVADPTGTDDNVDFDPLFCGGDGVYAIEDASAAALPSCGPMGAGEVGCGTVSNGDLPGTTPVVPQRLELLQNAPNPFNPSTMIAFSLPADGPIAVRVFDLRGRLLRVLAEGDFAAGSHQLVWDGRDLSGRIVASGTYFYELRTPERVLVRKMGLLK